MTEHANETNATDETAQGRLLGAADIRRIAAEAGISPTKKFGQNFVIDPGTVRRIVREAGVTADNHVLEVGPGLGSLTLAILETGATMTAVEIDPPVAERLPGTIAEFMPDAVDRFRVVNRDALTVTPENLPDFQNDDSFTLVANLPYNVATPILLTLLERFDNLGTFLVMVQKEVADRLSEKPGSKIYGTPSVKLAWYGTAERVGIIGRNVFWPAPNVDSALVLFKRYEGGHTPSANNPDGSVVDRENVFRLIDAAFGQRRKTLHAALKKIVPSEAFEQAGIDPQDIFVVSIMPCTAKKYEVLREEQRLPNGCMPVDVSLTTRELGRMITQAGLLFEHLPDGAFDPMLGVSTGAAAIFGASGGVMEAALRTVVEQLTGAGMAPLEYKEVRGMEGVKEASYELPGKTVRVCVASGLHNVKRVLDGIRDGSLQYDFVEFMACPGGCINGGGQPIQHANVRNFTDIKALRAAALYRQDEGMTYRRSHENPVVQKVYADFLGEPGGHKAHALLHCSYIKQKRYRV